MKNKVQKIREEVEKLHGNPYYMMAVKDVLEILDMQEEPVSIWHDGCEIPKSGTNILMIRKDEEDSNYPPIAGCFHGTNSRLDGRNWGYYNGFCYNEIEPPLKWAYVDDLLNLSNVERIGKDWKEEPVSEDFDSWYEKEWVPFGHSSCTTKDKLEESFKAGTKWQKNHLWKDAQGDDLPEIDREVIALLNNGKVVFAHRPYKGKYLGKNLTTGNIETFENQTFDKGEWNFPDVKYWLDCQIPKIED